MVVLVSQITLMLITAYQDFKEREISWLLIPGVLGLGITKAILDKVNPIELIASILFLSGLLLLVYLVFVIKHRTFKLNFTDELLGLGDILFFYAIIPFFGFNDYVLIFTGGLIFSLVSHSIYSLMHKSKSIPLAGWISIFLIFVFCWNY